MVLHKCRDRFGIEAQALIPEHSMRQHGRFKSVSEMVGEHCGNLRRYTVRSAGGPTRAYVDTSSEKEGEKPSRRKPKVSCSKVNLLRVSRPLRRG